MARTHKALWDFYDGEPFMQNPYLAVLNKPKRSNKMAKSSKAANRAKMAKVRAYKGKGKKAASKRKKASGGVHTHWKFIKRHERRVNPRRNAFPMAGVIANRRHRRRHNPSFMGVSFDLKSIMYVGGGFLATPMVEGFANKFIPAEIKANTLGRYAVKVASVIALTILTRTLLGGDKARLVAIGGGSYVFVSAINEFVPQITTMGSYHRSTTMGAYRPYGNQMRAISAGPGGPQNSIGGSISAGASRFTRAPRFAAR